MYAQGAWESAIIDPVHASGPVAVLVKPVQVTNINIGDEEKSLPSLTDMTFFTMQALKNLSYRWAALANSTAGILKVIKVG